MNPYKATLGVAFCIVLKWKVKQESTEFVGLLVQSFLQKNKH